MIGHVRVRLRYRGAAGGAGGEGACGPSMRAGATVETLSFEVGTAVGVSVDSGSSVFGPEEIGVSGARLFSGVGIVVANDGDAIGMSVTLDGKPLGVGTGELEGVPCGIGLLRSTPKYAAATQTATAATMINPRRSVSTGIRGEPR